MNKQRLPRQLDDVLQDPNASWAEIREAMKSSRGCTNAAIMGAIASGRGVIVTVPSGDEIGDDDDKLTDSDIAIAHARADDASDVDLNAKGGKDPLPDGNTPEASRVGAEAVVFLADLAPAGNDSADITNSQNRRPSRRAVRRGSHHGSHRGSVRSSLRRRNQASMRSQGSSGLNESIK